MRSHMNPTESSTQPLAVSPMLIERRERVFLMLAGVFLCAMTMLNILGITRFIQLGPWALAVGVLPYPITFICTDLICELYGRKRANFLVTFGLLLNIFILTFMWLGQYLPSATTQPPWQLIQLAESVTLPNGEVISDSVELFSLLYATTSGAVIASMVAYFAAQYCDVFLYHFWKGLTKGKHLWLRNNGSTMISQGVDSFMVIAVTFGAQFLAGAVSLSVMITLMTSNYLFKLLVALLDTIPLYICVHYLRPYLEIHEGEIGYHED